MLASNAIYKGVYELLNTPLGGKLRDHFDENSDDSAFPAIVMQDHTSKAWDTDDSEGVDMTLYIDVWSRYTGMKETQEYMQTVYDTLHHKEVDLAARLGAGYNVVLIELDTDETETTNDGKTHHGRISFRIVVDSVVVF